MRKFLFYCVLAVCLNPLACQQEINIGGPDRSAKGTLQENSAGDCFPKSVAGTYVAGTGLVATNTITVSVNITKDGDYSITTDTVNGYYFKSSGSISGIGITSLTLQGFGTPQLAGSDNFNVKFGSSSCPLQITVTAASVLATGTLDGSPNTCAPIVVAGTYVAGSPLSASHTVEISIDVTVAGSFNISSPTVGGISFSRTGTVGFGNDKLITLIGTGTPVAGSHVFTISFGATSCSFLIAVASPGDDYFPRSANSNWSYESNDNTLDSLYRVVLSSAHNAAGNSYNIFMQKDGPALDSSGYYRRSGGDYYEWADMGKRFGFDNAVWGEYIFLKDNVPIATNWKSPAFSGTISGVPVQRRLSLTVSQKDVALSFYTSPGLGNYAPVIVVDEKFETFDGVNWVDFTPVINRYSRNAFGRGFGLVKTNHYDGSGGITHVDELRRFVIW